MKCIKCGRETRSEFNKCPYCGENLQMVPDYSIYDEEDINVIMKETTDIKSKTNRVYMENEARERERREQERAKRTAEAKKKQQLRLTIISVITICVSLIVLAVVVKTTIDNKNNNSYEYQMKQADSAMFKGDIETAEEYYLRALALSDGNVEVRLELADLYLQKEDTNQAIKYLKDVLVYDSQNYTAYKMLYQFYSEAGDTAAIIELKNKATDTKVLNLFSDYAVQVPMLSLEGGNYSEDLSITITAKKDVEIYYTLDGTNPTENGQKYTSSIKLESAGMHTIKAVAKNALGVYSTVVSQTYVIEYEAPEDPVVTPNGGEFTEETYVYISVPSGCSAYYVWGSGNEVPTKDSTLYVSPIKIPEGRRILSVIIIDDKTGLESGIYRNTFEYIAPIPETEIILPEEGVPGNGIIEDEPIGDRIWIPGF